MIRNVTRQDQGTYICRGENGEGRRAVAAVSFVEVLREYTLQLLSQHRLRFVVVVVAVAHYLHLFLISRRFQRGQRFSRRSTLS